MKLAALCLTLGLLAGYYVTSNHYDTQIAKQERITHEAYRKAIAAERAASEKISKQAAAARSERDRLDRLYRDARASSAELRGLYTKLAAIGCDPELVNRGEATACHGRVLADVYGELQDLAGEYALAADRARVAGKQCEFEYDTQRGVVNADK